MIERPLPPEIERLRVDPSAPMVIVDVDEVLAMFMLGFERFVVRNGFEMRITRFALFENVYRPGDVTPIDQALGKALFDAFFDTDGEDIDPVVDAAETLGRLSEAATIIVLTNAPDKSRVARANWLAKHGFPYPLIINSGPKGAAVQALSQRTRAPAAFVDDLLPNLESVATKSPDTHRFQMVADERLRPLAYSDTNRHQRIDHWPTLGRSIAAALNLSAVRW